MLDTGATVNIIKLQNLNPDLRVKTDEALKIGGITNDRMQTIGTVKLTIVETPDTFHVVHDEFPIAEHGILGRNLMKAEKAVMSYYCNAIVLAGDVMNPIPFLTDEEKAYHLNQRSRPPGYGHSLAAVWNLNLGHDQTEYEWDEMLPKPYE